MEGALLFFLSATMLSEPAPCAHAIGHQSQARFLVNGRRGVACRGGAFLFRWLEDAFKAECKSTTT